MYILLYTRRPAGMVIASICGRGCLLYYKSAGGLLASGLWGHLQQKHLHTLSHMHRSTFGPGRISSFDSQHPWLQQRVSPSFLVYTHCQVFVQGANLKIPRASSKPKHPRPQTYIASGCLDSHKCRNDFVAQVEVGEALAQSV